MNNINILLVDDDLNKVTTVINTVREVFAENLLIIQASNVQEAIENLQKSEFHLLITDFKMPLRHQDQPDENGGQTLIKNLYRKRTNANVPMYIVGLTQYHELKQSYNGVWKVWHYDASSEEWRTKLRDLIHHISLVKSRVITAKIETIFVEGFSDKKLFQTSLNLYFPHLSNNIFIHAISVGGGASWVERQLFIWAKTLTWKGGKIEYLKAVGVFDNDKAGLDAISNIKASIPRDSADSKTFSIVKTSFKYSPLLKSIQKKGIMFPSTIEDLVTEEDLKDICQKGWLVKRDTSTIEIDKSILAITSIDEKSLQCNNFTATEILIILNKIDESYKIDFCKFLCEKGRDSLLNISYLLADILQKLKLLKTDS